MVQNEELPQTLNEGEIEISHNDLKQARLEELKNLVQEQLKNRLIVSKELTDKITTAKTQTKKKFYEKKMKAVRTQVVQLLEMLQHLSELDTQKNDTPTESPAEAN